MVKITNTPQDTTETASPTVFTRTRLKIGALVAVGALSLTLIGVTVSGFISDDTGSSATIEAASEGFDYAAWSNPDRFDMAESDDDFYQKGITVEGSVIAIVNGSVNGFGKAEADNEHHVLIAIDGRNSQSVFVRYVSEERTTPFEVGDEIVVTGVSKHLLGKDGIYVPSVEAEWVGEQ